MNYDIKINGSFDVCCTSRLWFHPRDIALDTKVYERFKNEELSKSRVFLLGRFYPTFSKTFYKYAGA